MVFFEVDKKGIEDLSNRIVRFQAEQKESCVHLILHKITDFTKQIQDEDELGRIIALLDDQLAYLQRHHPSVIVRFINDLSAIRQIEDRRSMVSAFKSSGILRVGVKVPNTVSFGQDIQCPVIMKPRSACGQPDSHSMLFIPTLAKFEPTSDVSTDGILQEFIPHYRVIYKVYVIGDRAELDLRSSIGRDTFDLAGEVKAFNSDSIKALPKLTNAERIAATKRIEPHLSSVKEASRMLSRYLRLDLFGWDLLLSEDEPGNLYIIDLNHFPKFEGVTNFHQSIYELINSKAKQISL